jgi:hypothetical protein
VLIEISETPITKIRKILNQLKNDLEENAKKEVALLSRITSQETVLEQIDTNLKEHYEETVNFNQQSKTIMAKFNQDLINFEFVQKSEKENLTNFNDELVSAKEAQKENATFIQRIVELDGQKEEKIEMMPKKLYDMTTILLDVEEVLHTDLGIKKSLPLSELTSSKIDFNVKISKSLGTDFLLKLQNHSKSNEEEIKEINQSILKLKRFFLFIQKEMPDCLDFDPTNLSEQIEMINNLILVTKKMRESQFKAKKALQKLERNSQIHSFDLQELLSLNQKQSEMIQSFPDMNEILDKIENIKSNRFEKLVTYDSGIKEWITFKSSSTLSEALKPSQVEIDQERQQKEQEQNDLANSRSEQYLPPPKKTYEF